MKLLQHKKLTASDSKEGFTIIEVMLVLAISGLLLVGVIGGTYSSIGRQRYTDALRDFAEYMRTVYSEVLSPQSLGIGNSRDQAILGKVLVFGDDSDPNNPNTVYSATLVGNAMVPLQTSISESFMDNLTRSDAEVRLFCGHTSNPEQPSTVASYTPLWQAELREVNDPEKGYSVQNPFKGTMIISRSLTSVVVHTVFLPDKVYNLRDQCRPEDNVASDLFHDDLSIEKDAYAASLTEATGICVKSSDSAVAREVRITADGRNTSAVKIIDEDSDNSEEANRCR